MIFGYHSSAVRSACVVDKESVVCSKLRVKSQAKQTALATAANALSYIQKDGGGVVAGCQKLDAPALLDYEQPFAVIPCAGYVHRSTQPRQHALKCNRINDGIDL